MDKENFEYAMQVYDNKIEEKTHTDKYVYTLYNFIMSAEQNNDNIYIGVNEEDIFTVYRSHNDDCTSVVEKFFDINGYEIEKPQNYKPPVTMRKISYTASRAAYDYLINEGSIIVKFSTSAMKDNIKYYTYTFASISIIIYIYEDLILYIGESNSTNKPPEKLKKLYDILIQEEENVNDLFMGEMVYITRTENDTYLYVSCRTNRLAITDTFGTILCKSDNADIVLTVIINHLLGKWESVDM